MSEFRLDQAIASRGLASSRTQAESYIKLGLVRVNGNIESSILIRVSDKDRIEITSKEQYVSRAGLKLASVVNQFNVDFRDKIVLDVGSSTGGFTDYSIKHGAKKVIAVDVGSNQMHESLRNNPIIELHEQCDIRDFKRSKDLIDIVLIDVSFISLRQILPTIYTLSNDQTEIIAMFKPQFEAESKSKNKGIIKNDRIRRDLIKGFEQWLKLNNFFIIKTLDSGISGTKGNLERFFLLKRSL
ncbi:MAG TPA: TlyA family RNA methyltransferase [Candidatus Dormibacteraeota bacterium]|nr:TlyA family RNA methyltransferase [Candidatus Dormibacteraeota bacterium]